MPDALTAVSHKTRPHVWLPRGLRDGTADNGVWLATTEEHHESLRREFPRMRSTQVFSSKVTGWQVLPADGPDFEANQAALCACEPLVKESSQVVTNCHRFQLPVDDSEMRLARCSLLSR